MKTTKSKKTIKLNLGCGTQIFEGWVNSDYKKAPGVDLVFDANKRWKLADGSVNEIYCSHVLEHLEDPCHFFSEAHRVLCPLGVITIRVPHGNSDEAMCDPTHKRQYYLGTFTNFTESPEERLKRTRCVQYKDTQVRFDLLEVEMRLNEELKKRFGKFLAVRFYRWFGDYLNNLVAEIVVVMQKPNN